MQKRNVLPPTPQGTTKVKAVLYEKYSSQLLVLITYLRRAPKAVEHVFAPYVLFLAGENLNEDRTIKQALENLRKIKPVFPSDMSEVQKKLLERIMDMLNLQKFYKLVCENEKCQKSFNSFLKSLQKQSSKTTIRAYTSSIKLDLIRPEYYITQLLGKYEAQVGVGQRFGSEEPYESIFYKQPRFTDKIAELCHLRKNNKHRGNIALLEYNGNFIIGKRSYAVAKDNYFEIWEKSQECHLYPFPDNPLLFQSRNQQFNKLLQGLKTQKGEYQSKKQSEKLRENPYFRETKPIFVEEPKQKGKSQPVQISSDSQDDLKDLKSKEQQLRLKKFQGPRAQKKSLFVKQMPHKDLGQQTYQEQQQVQEQSQQQQSLANSRSWQQSQQQKPQKDSQQQSLQEKQKQQKKQAAQKDTGSQAQSKGYPAKHNDWRKVSQSISESSQSDQQPEIHKEALMYKTAPPQTFALKRSFRFLGHSKKVTCASFSQDQLYIITGSVDRTIKLWCLRLKIVLATFESHMKTVWDVHFNPSGLYFLSGGADGMMMLWKTDHPKPQRIFAHRSDIYKVHFAKNPSYAISGGEEGILRIWHIIKAQIVKVINTECPIINFSLGHSGAYILVVQTDGRVTLHNIKKGLLVTSFYFDYKGSADSHQKRQPIQDICFSQDEKSIVCVTNKHILLYLLQSFQVGPKNLSDYNQIDDLLKNDQKGQKLVHPSLVLMSYDNLRFTFCRFRHRGMLLVGGTRYEPI